LLGETRGLGLIAVVLWVHGRYPRLPEGGVYNGVEFMKYSRPPRRLDRIFADASVFFVTCCTYRKRSKLANEQFHAAFVSFSERAARDFDVAVGRYVIMPDHLHLFVAGPNEFDLGKWIGVLKRVLGRAIPETDSADPIWQRGFFDHVLRSDESYAQKWEFVRENPVRAGLVGRSEAWPYSGEIVDLRL
jgi:REP-associated tyrosine transposase